jgi:hypothetical protein
MTAVRLLVYAHLGVQLVRTLIMGTKSAPVPRSPLPGLAGATTSSSSEGH